MLESPTLFGERIKAEKAELKKLKEKLNILEKSKKIFRPISYMLMLSNGVLNSLNCLMRMEYSPDLIL